MAGTAVVVLVCRCGGTRAVYTSASVSGQSDFASQNPAIVLSAYITKSACPPAAEKCPPTAICPYSRWRYISRVSRKQRYNTLDFCKQNRVPRNRRFLWILPVKGNAAPLESPQQGCCAPLLETQRQKSILSEHSDVRSSAITYRQLANAAAVRTHPKKGDCYHCRAHNESIFVFER